MSCIFISYRRADTAMAAGWLYHQLNEYFPGQLFMDIDDIPPGEDFVRVIEDAISQCRVVLVLIGPDWVSDRLDDPLDFVRLEVSTALSRPNVRVVPVLVNDASMPGPDVLPPNLQPLTRRNAVELSSKRFRYDVEQLARALGADQPNTQSGAQDAAQPLSLADRMHQAAREGREARQGRPSNLRRWITNWALLTVIIVFSYSNNLIRVFGVPYELIFYLVVVGGILESALLYLWRPVSVGWLSLFVVAVYATHLFLMETIQFYTYLNYTHLTVAAAAHAGLFALLWIGRGLWGRASQHWKSGEPSPH